MKFPRSIGIRRIPYPASVVDLQCLSCSVFREPAGSMTIDVLLRQVATSRSAIDQNADKWAYSSVGLERTPDKREVGSSNLPRPTSELIES